ncbi:hypothetical protein QTV34_000163 [Vibrio parahaemolyticus]|nr:hypothetical protein [Vibrio parahaemolyticus]
MVCRIIVLRCSPLKRALVANEKIAAKTECLGPMFVCFAVSEADLLVESQLCGIVSPKGLFGVVSSFSTALRVPSGFSDKRFETAPDLVFQHT